MYTSTEGTNHTPIGDMVDNKLLKLYGFIYAAISERILLFAIKSKGLSLGIGFWEGIVALNPYIIGAILIGITQIII